MKERYQLLPLTAVYWVIGTLAFILLPHLFRLPWWMSLLIVSVMLGRLYIARYRRELPGKLVLAGMALGGTGSIALVYGTLVGRDAGVALLTLMLSLKLMELRQQRDAQLALLLGLFVGITHYLFDQSIPSGLYSLLGIMLLLMAMMEIHRPSPATWKIRVRRAGGLLLQSIPLVLLLFVVFPRLSGPLWSLPIHQGTGLTGLDENMAPGRISNLTQSSKVVFRANFTGEIPEKEKLYWRGPVLWFTDGQNWTPGEGGENFRSVRYEGLGTPISYDVTLEPQNNAWVYPLDLPASIPTELRASRDFRLYSRNKLDSRKRFEMTSYVDYRITGLSRWERAWALQLPNTISGRTRDLVRQWRETSDSEAAIVEKALRYFREQEFIYTLQPPFLGNDPTDEFLFDTRQGFCEHYSAAFTVLMRLAGLPTRVVTGYQGGELNPVGNYLIIRQSDAHAWTEVWISGSGWVRVDPTAAVAPDRVRLGMDSDPALNGVVSYRGVAGEIDPALLDMLRYGVDAVNNAWNQWVLAYGPEQQKKLLSRLGLNSVDWFSLGLTLMIGLGALLLLIAAWLLWRRPRDKNPLSRVYAQFERRMRMIDLPRAPAEGPQAYADRVSMERPDLADEVQSFMQLYIRQKYSQHPSPQILKAMKRHLAQFRPKKTA